MSVARLVVKALACMALASCIPDLPAFDCGRPEAICENAQAICVEGSCAEPVANGCPDSGYRYEQNATALAGECVPPELLPLVLADGQAADLVLGQANFSDAQSGGGAVSMRVPTGVCATSDHLFVADSGNNRILVWTPIPDAMGRSPNFAVGQADFSGTTAATSVSGLSDPRLVSCRDNHLVVADRGNHRVLIWTTLPNDFNSLPNVVLGQPAFDTAAPGAGDSGLNSPSGGDLLGAAGALAITDTGNHRVLVWSQLPSADNTSADLVLGQPDFGVVDSNQGGSVTASTLNLPWSAKFFGTGLLLADSGNHRVAGHDLVPTANNRPADFAMGQTDTSSGLANQNGPAAADTLNTPRALCSLDDTLFVVDEGNHRVLMHTSTAGALSTSAIQVLGQPNMNSQTAQATLSVSLRAPGGCAITGRTLWVADTGNHRVLRYSSR